MFVNVLKSNLGIGEMNKNRQPNFLVVDKNTSVTEVEECLKSFIRRDDIDIILINQNVAEMVRHILDGHTAALPAILEIPSKVQFRRLYVMKQSLKIKKFFNSLYYKQTVPL